jgi:hypothetical protein
MLVRGVTTMMFTILFPLLAGISFAADGAKPTRCDLFNHLQSFKKIEMSMNMKLAAFNEYLNMTQEKDRHLPKHFEEFQNGGLYALKFNDRKAKKMQLVFRDTGAILGIFQNGKMLFCAKED